ncbi:hypothetical protein E2C01_071275 [Portunus trituberculatus]|uniref:Uncharacterized protein n=1 Tax=Portunus trituberculatus TaxID=210409 RepID=A0A5B7HZJ5_PORTR|nr:hypothetical protein [Portunus trituberculatus]
MSERVHQASLRVSSALHHQDEVSACECHRCVKRFLRGMDVRCFPQYLAFPSQQPSPPAIFSNTSSDNAGFRKVS